MGTSVLTNQFRFNGVVSTDKTVMQNFEAMCAAAMCWVTYDSKLGKWAVVINRAGTSTLSFDNSNIVGGISVTTTGLAELYNSVKVEFPSAELNDREDFASITIPYSDRNPNELDNELVIQSDLISDPVQAQYIGMVELKQNRLDKVVRFTTDFTGIQLMAGDLIDITTSMYGWTNKMFRVISITESDTDEGSIVFNIGAIEYNANVYSTDDLERFSRVLSPGIRSLGAIDTPSTPAITIYSNISDPYAEITGTVPEGVVNSIELYVSRDSVNYTFVGATYPEGGGAFETSQTVAFQYREIKSGTIYARIRATNSVGSSEFSPVGSTTGDLVQRTDAIGDNTAISDGAGGYLSLLLAVPKLLAALDTLMNGNEAGLSSVQSSVTFNIDVTEATSLAQVQAMTTTTNPYHIYQTGANRNRDNWIQTNVTIPSGWDQLELIFKTPTFQYSYDTIDHDGIQRTQQLLAQPAFLVSLYYGTTLDTAVPVINTTIDWNNNTQRINLPGPAAGTFWGVLRMLPTYNLDMYWVRPDTEANEVWPYAFEATGNGGSTGMQWTVRTI